MKVFLTALGAGVCLVVAGVCTAGFVYFLLHGAVFDVVYSFLFSVGFAGMFVCFAGDYIRDIW